MPGLATWRKAWSSLSATWATRISSRSNEHENLIDETIRKEIAGDPKIEDLVLKMVLPETSKTPIEFYAIQVDSQTGSSRPRNSRGR